MSVTRVISLFVSCVQPPVVLLRKHLNIFSVSLVLSQAGGLIAMASRRSAPRACHRCMQWGFGGFNTG